MWKVVSLWLVSGALVFLMGGGGHESFFKLIIPLTFVFMLVGVLRYGQDLPHLGYLLFFSISLTSLLGFTETLTGSHAESSSIMLYGLSFYTASLAYFMVSRERLGFVHAVKISNPLLLSTGPIALFIRPIKGRKLSARINYFLPFVIVGAFLFRVVATPLTEFFFLLKETDVLSAIVFAIIFEIFVYANFCGLSLVIFGVFGILGYRVPLNFRQPFSSNNLADFWKGWHTSLSSVLKVLFYAPLRSRFSLLWALLGVYLASAFWHGVTFNFLLWGAFHAFLFWVSIRLLKSNIRIFPFLIMVVGVVVGRLIFAESNTEQLLEKLSFQFDGVSAVAQVVNVPNSSLLALLMGGGLIAVEFFFQGSGFVRKRNYKHLRTPLMLSLIVLLSILTIANVGSDYAVYGQR